MSVSLVSIDVLWVLTLNEKSASSVLVSNEKSVLVSKSVLERDIGFMFSNETS